MLQRLVFWIILLLVGWLLMPLAVYTIGTLMAGPYSGPGGLPGLYAGIYADALRLHPAAHVLLNLPVVLTLIWTLCSRLRQLVGRNTNPAKAA